jgi:hypothetical protein
MGMTTGDEKLGESRQSRFLLAFVGYLTLVVGATWLVPRNWGPNEVLPALITAKPYVIRIERFLHSAENPELILMGSSLVLKPSVECDRAFEKLALPSDEVEARNFKQGYTKSVHLQRLLQSKVKGSFALVDLGVPSGMADDYYLILQKLKDFNKRPRLIVLGLAPRDFVDNRFTDTKDTVSYELLSCCAPMRKWPRHLPAIFEFVWHVIPPFVTVDGLADAVKAKRFSYRYDLEARLKEPLHWIEDKCTLVLSGQQQANQDANHGALRHNSQPRYFDLAAYDWCYNPPDLDHFRRQTACLEKFVVLARQWKVPLVIVDMPISAENQALISPEVLGSYKQFLLKATKKYNVLLVDAAKLQRYDAQDFADSAHMNASGGHKCFLSLVNAISANSRLCEQLCSVRTIGAM